MNVIYKHGLQDEDDLFRLYETLGWNDFLNLSSSQLALAMSQSLFVVYVYAGSKLVGTGRVVSDGVINAYLCGLGVLPDYRNQGIGTQIIERLVAFCTERSLHVQFFCEENLIPYYEKIGFKKFAAGMKL